MGNLRHLMPVNPAPFVRKTFDIVSDPSTNAIVCWSSSGSSFLVLEEHAFQKEVLPKYFKHDNLCSFIRQLNTYGFRKVSGSKDLNSSQTVLEFEQPEFRKDRPDLLANLKRKLSNFCGKSSRKPNAWSCNWRARSDNALKRRAFWIPPQQRWSSPWHLLV